MLCVVLWGRGRQGVFVAPMEVGRRHDCVCVCTCFKTLYVCVVYQCVLSVLCVVLWGTECLEVFGVPRPVGRRHDCSVYVERVYVYVSSLIWHMRERLDAG